MLACTREQGRTSDGQGEFTGAVFAGDTNTVRS